MRLVLIDGGDVLCLHCPSLTVLATALGGLLEDKWENTNLVVKLLVFVCVMAMHNNGSHEYDLRIELFGLRQTPNKI